MSNLTSLFSDTRSKYMKNYTLMHKNIPVIDVEIDEASSAVIKVNKPQEYEHLPIGTANKGIVSRENLNSWWKGRAIPASRDNIQNLLQSANLSNLDILLTKSFGLSLSDQYWIKPLGSNIDWHDVNFFENDFSENVGDLLFGNTVNTTIDFNSPDNTSDGWLKKRWKIVDGKRCLIKAGSNPFQQEPYNEVIASKLMNILGINHTSYSVVWLNGYPYSICEDFITSETELITANRIMQIRKKSNHESYYQHLVNCCNDVDIDIVPFLDEMLTVDYIIANEDRHFNNFGLIRNVGTLEFIGTAPIYDSGTSLFYNRNKCRFGELKTKPFKAEFHEQIKLVSSFDWLDFSRLSSFDNEVYNILSELTNMEFISESKRNEIAQFVKTQIENITKLI